MKSTILSISAAILVMAFGAKILRYGGASDSAEERVSARIDEALGRAGWRKGDSMSLWLGGRYKSNVYWKAPCSRPVIVIRDRDDMRSLIRARFADDVAPIDVAPSGWRALTPGLLPFGLEKLPFFSPPAFVIAPAPTREAGACSSPALQVQGALSHRSALRAHVGLHRLDELLDGKRLG